MTWAIRLGNISTDMAHGGGGKRTSHFTSGNEIASARRVMLGPALLGKTLRGTILWQNRSGRGRLAT